MALQKVLERVDANAEASLERLFAFLAIPSISTVTPCMKSAGCSAFWGTRMRRR